jgi:hypothetical protein
LESSSIKGSTEAIPSTSKKPRNRMTTSRKKSFLLSFALSMSIIFLIALSLYSRSEEVPENANDVTTYGIKPKNGLHFLKLMEYHKANKSDFLILFVYGTFKLAQRLPAKYANILMEAIILSHIFRF